MTRPTGRPDEIMEEIDHHRDEIERTLGAIESKLAPERILDNAVDYVRHGPGDYFANLGGTVKQNPIPAALVGIGLSWLAASGRYEGDGYTRRESSEGTGQKLGEKASELSGRARELSGRARERAGAAAGSLSGTAEEARRYSRRGSAGVQRGYRYLVEDQPLLLGALGVAMGLAMGASLPHTETEDELMGDERDDLFDRAKEAGSEAAREAKETAKEAGEAAKETVRERTGLGEERPESAGHHRTQAAANPEVSTPEKRE